jgi:hypothetical protein
MRCLVTAAWLLLCPLTSALAQVSIGIRLPSVSIGFNMPIYPTMVPVPGYPVYYAPGASSNYFFYDGLYWVYQGDSWYSSSWYNGPWMLEAPELVPAYVLRVPVRYYRHPPAYFAGWRMDAPPRWGERWGTGWQRQHRGWEAWDRSRTPRPAPLPTYQKRYSGMRYPEPDRQPAVHDRNYQYRPRDSAVRQAYQAHGLRDGPPPARPGDGADQRARSPQQHDAQRERPSSPNTMTPHRSPPEPRGEVGRSGAHENHGHGNQGERDRD